MAKGTFLNKLPIMLLLLHAQRHFGKFFKPFSLVLHVQ
jgi:hypothetical protein